MRIAEEILMKFPPQHYFRLFLITALILVGQTTGLAAERRVALVIGNAAYPTAPLKNPVNDARAISAKLKNLGFEVITRENITQRQIGAVLREFRSRLTPGAEALFFYAGHGLQVKGINYLPAIDADISAEEDVPTQSIDANKVLEIMEESRTRLNLVFLDACRNNPFTRRFRSTEGGLAKMAAPSGTILAFATRPGSIASDGDGANGLYTQYLLQAMDERGILIEQSLKKVYSGVKRASKGKQEPWTEGGIEGDFYFRPADASVAAAPQGPAAPRASAEEEAWAAAQGADSAAGYAAYLAEYPKGRFAAAARIKLATLKAAKPVAAQATLAMGQAPKPAPAVQSPGPSAASPGQAFRDCDECPEMVIIPAGRFEMGSPSYERGRKQEEGPLHQVNVPSFAIGKTEVTRGQFAAFVSETGYQAGNECQTLESGKAEQRTGRNWRNPGFQQDDSHPVVCVNYHDIKAYLEWLSRKTAKRYRLPSESEWEYAARAGTLTARYWGENSDQACSHANVADKTISQNPIYQDAVVHGCSDYFFFTSPAGSFLPNAFGLYDMIGNVWEEMEDTHHEDYSNAPGDGSPRGAKTVTGAIMLSGPVLRGASWLGQPDQARSAMRGYYKYNDRTADRGFRVARSLQ